MSRARELLARHGLRPKKAWGQNFLEDARVRARIVAAAGIAASDVVVEIGAGLGALTGLLADTGARVTAIERDPDLVAVLRTELGERANLEIAAADALEFDFAALAPDAAGTPGAGGASSGQRGLIVVGNLPYQITSPLIFRMIGQAAHGHVIARAVLMVQREFAERLVAKPGGKIYGRLSVMAQQQAACSILFHVGPGAFLPPPAVSSTVVRMEPRQTWLAPVRDEALFTAVVRAAFGARRKMLRGALGAAFAQADEALAAADVAGTRRAEELGVPEFARIADRLFELGERGQPPRPESPTDA